jgi:hypothetical protein
MFNKKYKTTRFQDGKIPRWKGSKVARFPKTLLYQDCEVPRWQNSKVARFQEGNFSRREDFKILRWQVPIMQDSKMARLQKTLLPRFQERKIPRAQHSKIPRTQMSAKERVSRSTRDALRILNSAYLQTESYFRITEAVFSILMVYLGIHAVFTEGGFFQFRPHPFFQYRARSSSTEHLLLKLASPRMRRKNSKAPLPRSQ